MKLWRTRTTIAISVAIAVTTITAAPVMAIWPASVQSATVVNKTALLASLNADLTLATDWAQQAARMGYLGSQRTAIAGDASQAYTLVAQLLRRTQGDSSDAALSRDSAEFTRLDMILTSLEGPKIALAALANSGLGDYQTRFGFVRTMELAGGTNPHSPLYTRTIAIEAALGAVKTNLDHGVALLDVSALGRYPASLSTLSEAGPWITRGMRAVGVADQLRIQDLPLANSIVNRYGAREQVKLQIRELTQLRHRVVADRNLTSGELANILTQIDADLAAMNKLNSYVIAASDGTGMAAELFKLANEPGVFFLIKPKADIMLAAADDRAAVHTLNALLPILHARIDVAAARHKDTTQLNALLSDLLVQMAAVNADIAPIDAEFESMTAITATQVSHDGVVIHMARAALSDAFNRLTQGQSDAEQIIAGTP